MLFVGFFVQSYHTGHTDRPTALPRLHIGHGSRVLHKHVGRRIGRRGFAAIVESGCPLTALKHQHEAATTNAGALRLDKAQHQVGGYGGIDHMTALGQHLNGGVCGIGVSDGGHGAMRPCRRSGTGALGGARQNCGADQNCGE